MARAAALRDRGPRRRRLLFAQGVHPADAALPRQLPLLHLRPSAAPQRTPPICHAGRGAGDRPRRRRRRLQGGAVHARRQAGAALSRGARRARPARPCRPRWTISPRWPKLVLRGDRAAAAPQSRRDVDRRHRPAAHGLGVARPDAGDRRPSASARRGGPHFGSPDKLPAVRLATIAAAGEASGAVHLRHPDRHRRDPQRADRGAARIARPAPSAMGTCRRSSSRTSAPSRARAWRGTASRRSTSISGPSRWRGSCSAPT